MGEAQPSTTGLTDEQRFRLLSENPRDVVYHLDTEGHLLWVSTSISAIFGFEPEEVLGRKVESLLHPEDAAATAEDRVALRAGIRIASISAGVSPPMRLVTKTGGFRWVSVVASPLTSPDGTPRGIVGRLRDIHDLVIAREAARATEELRQTAFDTLLDPLIVMEPVYDGEDIVDFAYLEANPAACAYNNMSYQQMVGARLLEINPGNRTSGNFAELVEVFRTGAPLIMDNYAYDQELRGGERRYYDLRVARAGNTLIYTWRDSTDRVEAERALAEREDLYRLVTEGVTDAVVRFDEDAVITWVSPSFERLTGFLAEHVVGRLGLDLLSAPDVESARALLRGDAQADESSGTRIPLTRADGSRRWVSAVSRPFVRVDGTVDGYVTVLRDLTGQVEAEERREHEVGHDSLTGLANRGLAVARIDRALEDGLGPRRIIALLCIGVDRLTTVNQALNYAAGDRVLTTIAGRIAGAVGDPDRVARVAGDEFIVLLTGLSSPAEAASMAERLCTAARGTVDIAGQSIEPTVSIGVAIGERGSSSEELLRKASLAVRQAKDAGRNRWQFVDPHQAIDAQARLRIEARLRDIVRDHLIVPWFQPVVTLSDRRLQGFEALVRWDVSGDTPTPEEFLPVAESSGLILDIDLSILAHAVDLLKVVDVGHVAVNVSPPSLASGGYTEGFHQILADAEIDPTRLRLEVTETALLGLSPSIAHAMQDIAARGATWYVDDFGTGFSSISHLRDLPVRGLKLDKSFTAGIRNGDSTCIKLSQGLIGLAEGLGLDTVAEGIETEFEAGALLGQGWHLGQGWLFGRPSPRPTWVSARDVEQRP